MTAGEVGDGGGGSWGGCCGEVTSPRGVLQIAGEENQDSAAETQPKR